MSRSNATTIGDAERREHLRWLIELTSLPTAAGKEHRIIEWVERWMMQRPGLTLDRDAAGNLVISMQRDGSARSTPNEGASTPIFFTAHLDHPAFVIDRIVAPGVVSASFRGGVMAPYFESARVVVHAAGERILPGRIVESEAGEPFRRCVIELDSARDADHVRIGDIARWDLPASRVEGGLLRAPACDDLAAVAAALAALDVASHLGESVHRELRVLLTRAEEVGFIGAIAACKLGTMPPGSTVIALENSRSFADSPIGAGPIVRVGDRMSTFSPGLTRAIAALAERLAGQEERRVGDATPKPASTGFKWQRKLMAGGACEASAFGAWGYDSTCLCLAMGNYHNMGELERVQEAVQRGEKDVRASIAPEIVSVEDFQGLVELLVACATSLGDVEPMTAKLEKLYEGRKFVLD